MANRREHSYGIIPLKKKEGVWNVLLVQLHAGHWGFPKGHPNNHETTLDTAQRELLKKRDSQLPNFCLIRLRMNLIFSSFREI